MKHAKGMKRTMLLMTLALLLFGARAEAQDWKEALKKAVTSAADEATGGKLTARGLLGRLRHALPAALLPVTRLPSSPPAHPLPPPLAPPRSPSLCLSPRPHSAVQYPPQRSDSLPYRR